MPLHITDDVSQVARSGYPIHNFANSIFYNDLTGPTGIVYNDNLPTYQNTVDFTSGNWVRLDERFDNPTYY
jgi:hypothetical protein